jgi:hypothetical protein
VVDEQPRHGEEGEGARGDRLGGVASRWQRGGGRGGAAAVSAVAVFLSEVHKRVGEGGAGLCAHAGRL